MIAPYLLKPTLNSICNKVNVKVAALRRVRKFIPPGVMVNIYKAFILPHFEYCAPVLAGLSSGLSNKLELTNHYAITSLMNMSKLSSYSDLLTHVDLKTLEHRRYSHALILFHKCMYNMRPINIKEMFIFRNNEYDLRGFNKLLHKSYLYITSRL